MMSKLEIQNNIEKLNKANRLLISASVLCMFSYVILLGLTAANVVSLRTTNKLVEDSKTELGQIELSYMNLENMMATLDLNSANFAEPENIAYVSSKIEETKPVAILDKKN